MDTECKKEQRIKQLEVTVEKLRRRNSMLMSERSYMDKLAARNDRSILWIIPFQVLAMMFGGVLALAFTMPSM